jgi:hypothetical protein
MSAETTRTHRHHLTHIVDDMFLIHDSDRFAVGMRVTVNEMKSQEKQEVNSLVEKLIRCLGRND